MQPIFTNEVLFVLYNSKSLASQMSLTLYNALVNERKSSSELGQLLCLRMPILIYQWW